MTASVMACDSRLDARARLSLGASHQAIYRMVLRALDARGIEGGTLVDVGCGGGGFWRTAGSRFARYVGVDAVRYDGFPDRGQFCQVDLDSSDWGLARGVGDVVAAIEVIEHMENPWAFMRQLAAVARPGGWIIVTTPNQLSGLSLLTLVARSRFSAFQDTQFPAHRTALLPVDLQRAAAEAELDVVEVGYSLSGRLPLSSRHYPTALSRLFPRWLSDNLMMVARKPAR